MQPLQNNPNPDNSSLLQKVASLAQQRIGGDSELSKTVSSRLPEFVKVFDQLIQIENHPNNRNGKAKAEFIHEWLTKRDVSTEIVPVENQDPTKQANMANKWYNVVAHLGDPIYDPQGIYGMFIAHHDQVAKLPEEIHYGSLRNDPALEPWQKPEEAITHPWAEDNTFQLVSALFEMVDFQKWWSQQKQSIGLIGQIKGIISDGEEINTLGMRGLLDLWKDEDKLHPLHFGVIGEGTAQAVNLSWNGESKATDIVHVAHANSGKGTGFIQANNIDFVYDTAVELFARMLEAQVRIWNASLDNSLSDNMKESLPPTRVPFTYGYISQRRMEVYFESRTNKVVNTRQAREIMMDMMTDTNLTSQINPDVFEVFFHPENITVIPEQQYWFLKISNGKPLHPGKFNPFIRMDGCIGLMIVLSFVEEEDRKHIQEIGFGDPKFANSIFADGYIRFSKRFNIQSFVKRIREIKTKEDAKNTLKEFHLHVMNAINGSLNHWRVILNGNVPDREALGIPERQWWIVQTAQKRIQENLGLIGVTIPELPAIVFPAMTDAGPMTYENNYKRLLMYGENIITMGTGNIDRRHLDSERITPETLIMAMVQYHGLLQSLVMETYARLASFRKASDNNV